MRLFTLFIGTNRTDAKAVVINIVSSWFESYTLLAAEGCFRGATEPAWLVKLATDDADKVIETAAQIREALNQDGVGIEYGGRYYRCTATDLASALSSTVKTEST